MNRFSCVRRARLFRPESLTDAILLVFVVSILLQVGFILILNFSLTRYKREENSTPPPVSIIIAARNEEENIEKLLNDLENQSFTHFEVIVSDNGSTDGTKKIVEGYSFATCVPAGEAPSDINNKKWALIQGIERASNEHMIFTDADVRVGPEWVGTMARGFAGNNEIVLGVSPYFKQKGFLNRFIRYESLFTAFQYVGFTLLGKPYMGVGRNMGYHKSVWKSVNGFEGVQNIKGGDDDLIVNKAASNSDVSLVLGEASLVYTYPEESIKDFFRQKIRHLSVGRLYKSKDKLMLGIFLLSLFLLTGTGVFLILSGWEPFLVLGGLAARYAFFIPAFISMNRKMGGRFEWAYIVLLDILYPVYYISAAIGTLWAKKIQWK